MMSTVYVKIVDAKGQSRIEERQAWDVDKFLASMRKNYAEDEDNPSTVQVATRVEYLQQIKRRKK